MTDRDYATPFTMLHAANLLGQKSRIEKFSRAIGRVVKDGDYVVDIGTGSGVLAILAAKAGADKVTAIDINPESIQYARIAAKMNEVDDAIEFVESHFEKYVPDNKADVVICEMLSSIMLVEQQIPASAHAVEHILKSDGVILPQEITIFLVPVECTDIWERFRFNDLEFPRVVQTATREVTRDLADMQVLESIDLTKLKRDTRIDNTLQFKAVDKGVVHGVVGVFESKLLDDITLNMKDGWKPLLIPLTEPIDVDVGHVLSFRITYQPGKFDTLSLEVS
ncbi:MAG: 50S ribosomal protein L11 methyltransferase [Candidatus Thorarchaeota archaeon]